MRSIVVSSKDRPSHFDPGAAPMLQWIKIADLVIDESYQRDLKPGNWKAIRRIAAAFQWSRFSPVFIAPVEGGKYAIIDGQHRTHAAAMCGLAEVPCQIVHMTVEEQAASFAAVNGLVTKVTGWQIYKAALAAREPWADECFKAVDAAGCKLMVQNKTTNDKVAGEIFALALVRQHVKAGRADMVTLALSAIRQAECGSIADYYSGPILKVWFSVLADRLHLAAVNLAEFLDEFDIWDAYEQADEAAKKKRRMGFATVTRFDLASATVGEALDAAFPQPTARMAMLDAVSKIAAA